MLPCINKAIFALQRADRVKNGIEEQLVAAIEREPVEGNTGLFPGKERLSRKAVHLAAVISKRFYRERQLPETSALFRIRV
jgi:hypothetical protein